VAEARQEEGDPRLRELFEQFDSQLVSPGGAAALLGLSRKTIHTLGKNGDLRVFRSTDDEEGQAGVKYGPKWVFIPMEDLRAYAERVGRPFPRTHKR
jgi:hypothetical protein